MQIFSLRIKSYRSWHIDDKVYSDLAYEKLRVLQEFDKLVINGCKEIAAL